MGKVYGSTVTITNGSALTQKIETLFQVPEGSIPVKNGSYTKGISNLKMKILMIFTFFKKGKFELVGPYSIATVKYFFYFPKPGTFRHFPFHATKDGQVYFSSTLLIF